MNKHPLAVSATVSTAFALALSALTGCASSTSTHPATNVAAATDDGWTNGKTRAAAGLQLRQVALANAFIARLPDLAREQPHPNDPSHCAAVEAAARHMQTRATSRLAAHGITVPDVAADNSPEAEELLAADTSAVEALYLNLALALQRDVLRAALRSAAEPDGTDGAAEAREDLTFLTRIGGAAVGLPQKELTAAAPAPGGGPLPTVASGKEAASNPNDEAMKRRGFTSHPGYTPK
jgi:hypothetical protein